VEVFYQKAASRGKDSLSLEKTAPYLNVSGHIARFTMTSNSVQASSHRFLTGNLLRNRIRYQLYFSRRNFGNLVYRIRIIVLDFKKIATAFPLILILLSTCTLLYPNLVLSFQDVWKVFMWFAPNLKISAF